MHENLIYFINKHDFSLVTHYFKFYVDKEKTYSLSSLMNFTIHLTTKLL